MGHKRRTSSTSSSSSSADVEYEIKYLRRKVKELEKRVRRPRDSGESEKENGRHRKKRRHVSPEFDTSDPISDSSGPSDHESRPGPEKSNCEKDPLSIEFVEVPSLDSEVLGVLGSDITPEESLGDPLHKDIALRWETILRKGLDGEIKSKLIEKYPVISNCLALRPPKINPEVKVASNEAALKRDDYLKNKQSQMAASLSALGQALSNLLNEKEGGGKGNNLQIVELISDTARLIADLHHQESRSRQTLISLNLDKSLKDSLNSTILDEWLFGDNLTERLKSVKAIEKSGEGLKKMAKAGAVKSRHLPKNGKYPPRQVAALGGQRRQFKIRNQQTAAGSQFRYPQGSRENKYRRHQFGTPQGKERKRERKP